MNPENKGGKKKMKDGERLFLRVSKSGNGVRAFQPTTGRNQATWLLMGSLSKLKEFVAGDKDYFILTYKKIEKEGSV